MPAPFVPTLSDFGSLPHHIAQGPGDIFDLLLPVLTLREPLRELHFSACDGDVAHSYRPSCPTHALVLALGGVSHGRARWRRTGADWVCTRNRHNRARVRASRSSRTPAARGPRLLPQPRQPPFQAA